MFRVWRVGRWLLAAIGLVLLIGQADRPALAVGRDQLAQCRTAAFSTEQSFYMQDGEPVDGNRWISDGDLLAPAGFVCARNADLTQVFSPTGGRLPDLGLDAADVLNVDDYLVAFSTDIDGPNNAFKSGDLLITNGAIIPNIALVAPFFAAVSQPPYDVGLDEVKLVGSEDNIRAFIDFAKEVPRAAWLESPGRLRDELTRYKIDIWFSVEETALTPNFTPIFLDGDLLAATGSIIVHQGDFFPLAIPAGLPTRGVDFGLDAFAITIPRNADRATLVRSLVFSIEISYTSEEPPLFDFTDGDVLRYGTAAIVNKNYDLIQAFNPAAKDLGLDALSLGSRDPLESKIQVICNQSTLEFDGGEALVGGPGTGLYMKDRALGTPKDPRRPCGAYVPIDGTVPAGATKFRVTYRPAGTPRPAFGAPGNGVRTEWSVAHRDPAWFGWCYAPDLSNPLALSLATDADGWMDATNYLQAKNGTGSFSDGCVNAEMRFGVWNSPTAPDPNGHYVVWLEWVDGAGNHQENADHHIQLDNRAPTDAPGSPAPVKLQIRLDDGITIVPPCGEAPTTATKLQVWGQFDDPYYWYFTVALKGGLPPTVWNFGPHNYYDPTDGTLGLKNTNDTGTTPDSTLVHLRDIDLTTLGPNFGKCCYLLEMYVWDASLRYSFDNKDVNVILPHYGYQFLTFSAGGP